MDTHCCTLIVGRQTKQLRAALWSIQPVQYKLAFRRTFTFIWGVIVGNTYIVNTLATLAVPSGSTMVLAVHTGTGPSSQNNTKKHKLWAYTWRVWYHVWLQNRTARKSEKKKRENKWGGQRKAHLVHVIHVHRFEAGNLAELPLFSVPARPPSCHPQTQQ